MAGIADQFKGLPMSDLIGQPLLAAAKAQGKLSTHTLRYWEKEFKEIKPFIFAGKRRYYDENLIKILKKIHFLLKNQGMTIKGVKKILKIKDSQLDETNIKTII